MIRPRQFAGISLMLLAAVTAWAAEDPVVPAGVHYKTASAEVNAKATQIIKKALAVGASGEDIAAMFDDKVVICGAGLWLDLKDNPKIAKIDGGNVTIVVPITPTDGTAPHDEKMEGKLFQTKEDIAVFAHELAATSDLTNLKVRKLTGDELKLYWAMISFDIEEPVFIAECGNRKILLQFSKPEDLHVVWVDDLGQYHTDKNATTAPTTAPVR